MWGVASDKWRTFVQVHRLVPESANQILDVYSSLGKPGANLYHSAARKTKAMPCSTDLANVVLVKIEQAPGEPFPFFVGMNPWFEP